MAKKQKDFKGLVGLWPFFRPFWKEITLALLALLVTALMVLFFGKAIKYLIDLGFVQGSKTSLNLTLVYFMGATLIMAAAGYFRSSLINAVAEKAITNLRKKAYGHVVQISAEFFEVFKAGDVISRLTTDATLLYSIISSSISFLLRNIILFIGGICFLFFSSVTLTLVTLLLIPVAIAPIVIMGRKIKSLSHQTQEAVAQVGSHIEESVNGIRTIQSYLCEEKATRTFNTVIDQSLQFSLEKIKARAMMVAVVIAFAFGVVGVILWVGGHEVLNDKMSAGDLSSFIFYSIITAISLVALSQISGQLQTASSAATRILELLKLQSPVKEATTLLTLPNHKKVNILFDKVCFAYPSREDHFILQDFDLEIKAGSKLVIVGESGAGKSTILQLLLRFYDVNQGKILLNDVDIRSLSFANLRQSFSYIAQDCFIFSGTVFDNIAYVDKDITKQEVQDIVDQNKALHFINELPDGIDSYVGQKGIKLSGGQRQRIAIARAIVKDSPILLLDEALSSLDNENAGMIKAALDEISYDKTVISIVHDLSSIDAKSQIIFLKNGVVAESGTHQELLAMQGLYSKVYALESS